MKVGSIATPYKFLPLDWLERLFTLHMDVYLSHLTTGFKFQLKTLPAHCLEEYTDNKAERNQIDQLKQ